MNVIRLYLVNINFYTIIKVQQKDSSEEEIVINYNYGKNMPKINKYVDISEVDREAKKDLIDRHSPFITCNDTAVSGEPFEVTVKMGNEYTHPDDFDHYIDQ